MIELKNIRNKKKKNERRFNTRNTMHLHFLLIYLHLCLPLEYNSYINWTGEATINLNEPQITLNNNYGGNLKIKHLVIVLHFSFNTSVFFLLLYFHHIVTLIIEKGINEFCDRLIYISNGRFDWRCRSVNRYNVYRRSGDIKWWKSS